MCRYLLNDRWSQGLLCFATCPVDFITDPNILATWWKLGTFHLVYFYNIMLIYMKISLALGNITLPLSQLWCLTGHFCFRTFSPVHKPSWHFFLLRIKSLLSVSKWNICMFHLLVASQEKVFKWTEDVVSGGLESKMGTTYFFLNLQDKEAYMVFRVDL